MKTTLLAGLCLVLMGVIVGLVAPSGSLAKPFAAVFRRPALEALLHATPSSPPVEVASALAAPGAERLADVAAAAPDYERPAELTSVATLAPQGPADECTTLTEAAHSGYMNAGYATQAFALASINSKEDKASQAAMLSARDQYRAALRDAHARIAEASRAKCWSLMGLLPPNIAAFEASLPNPALAALAR